MDWFIEQAEELESCAELLKSQAKMHLQIAQDLFAQAKRFRGMSKTQEIADNPEPVTPEVTQDPQPEQVNEKDYAEYPHSDIPKEDWITEKTRKAVFAMAGELWPYLNAAERQVRLRVAATRFLKMKVSHISKLSQVDALELAKEMTRVCEERKSL